MKNFIANAEKKLDAWGEKLEKINISYPSDLVTGILFLVVSVVILLIMPQQVAVSEKDVVNGRAFPTMLAYLMMAMSVLMTGSELVKLVTKKPLTMKTLNALAEVKALTIIAILLVTYLLAKVTDLFVIGGLFCAVAFLVYFRCKKKSYYRVKGSGTYFHKDQALSRELSDRNAKCKIGLILQGQDPNANSKLIDGIRSVLAEQRVDLHIFLTDNKFSNERRCLQTVVHQNFQGFIVDGVKASIMSPNLDCYQELYRRRIPVIFYNNYYKNLRYPRVIVNDMECAEKLVGRLIQAGHKRIAGIFVYDNYQSVEKFQGMAEAMRRNGVELKDHYIKWCISDEAHSPGYARIIEKFLRGLPKCTAIVCCNYMIYLLVRQALEKMGKSIPEDYSLVCFDYSDENLEKEGITCSVTRSYEMGCELGKRLMRMIENKNCDDKNYSHIMKPVIHEGTSIREI